MTTFANNAAAVIALDGGTTNTRARLVENGQVIAETRRAVGVRDRAISASGSPVAQAVRECLDELETLNSRARDAEIVASGMLTSEVGLRAVPHALAPAGLIELARASVVTTIPEITDRPIRLIPGVCTPPADGPTGWLSCDIMRGEECETLGTLALLDRTGPLIMVWPGSHTKYVEIDELNRIVSSHTCLTGELTMTIARQTLIAKSLPETLPETPDQAALILGRNVSYEKGLSRAAFLVRIADVQGVLSPHERASFWVGAVIGDELARVAGHPILKKGYAVLVGGREPQRSTYVEGLKCAGLSDVTALDDKTTAIAAALGAVAIARESILS